MSTASEAVSYDPTKFSEQGIELEQYFVAPFLSFTQGGISQVVPLKM